MPLTIKSNNPRRSSRFLPSLAFVLVLFITFWLRTQDIATMPPGLHFDEGLKIYRPWRIASGYGLPMAFGEAPEPFDGIVRGIYAYFVGVKPVNLRIFSALLGILGVAGTIGASRALFKKNRDQVALIAGLALAVNPASVVIGRAIYRANWVSPMTMLALWALAVAWNTRRTRFYVLAAVFAGLGAIMYLAGLFIPPTILALAALAMLLDSSIPRRLSTLVKMALGTALVMIPWFYLYFTIPDWLTIRVSNLKAANGSLIPDSGTFLSQFGRATSLIYAPGHQGPSYNTYTTAFLNPALLVLFVIGLAACLYTVLRWRSARALAPLAVLAGMLLPAALSNNPQEAIRFGGIFGSLGLLCGQGASTIQAALPLLAHTKNRVMLGGTAALLVFSPLYTWAHVRDHFVNWPGDDGSYFVVLRQQMEYIVASPQPIYFPVDYLNYQLSTAYLRPEKFPSVHGYGGEPLPAGEIFIPFDATYGSPLINRPTTAYALLLPDKGEIVILPPLSADVPLEAEVRSKGVRRPLPPGSHVAPCPFDTCPGGEETQYLGYAMPVTTRDNPFNQVMYRRFDGQAPLAVFDDTLELMDMVAPEVLKPGDLVDVTLYWRLKHKTSTDYSALIQLWDSAYRGWGNQDNTFTAIFGFLAPTPMWNAGEIYVERRWVQVVSDAHPGGYHFALHVYTPPGPRTSPFTHQDTIGQFNGWMLGARAIVGLPAGEQPAPNGKELNVILGHAIQLRQIDLNPPLNVISPDHALAVKLYWKAIKLPAGDNTLFVHLLDAGGNLIAQRDARPDDLYPTDTWNVGFETSSSFTLAIPAQSVGPFSIEIGMYTLPSQTRIPLEQNGVELANDVWVLK